MFLLLAVLNFSPKSSWACCMEDNRTLSELLLQDKRMIVFKCRILSSYTDTNSNFLSSALLIEVYFGEVKSKYVTLNTGSKYSSTGGWQLSVGSEMMIYTYGSGPGFSCGGICDNRTHPVPDNKAGESEVQILKSFAAIYKKSKSGIFKFLTADNTILSEGVFKKGVPVGVWKHYNYNGKIKQQINLDTGDAIQYNVNGEVTQENIAYQDSVVTVVYIDKQKNLTKLRQVKMPNDTGYVYLFYDYFQNGRVKSIEGNSYVQRATGSVSGKGKAGMYREYYDNGTLRLKGEHALNRRTGLWIWYEENGSVTAQFDYKDGTGSQ